MIEVARVTTPLTPFQMGEALIAGHRRYFGAAPNPRRLSVAWSQCALEHAQGAKLYNFNFGNVTAGANYDGEIYVMHVPPPDPPVLRFRSFESPDDGALDYWGMLAGHYRPAMTLFDQGRAFDACIMLGRLGYFTDKPEKYATGVAAWQKWYERELASSFTPELAEGQGNSVLSQQEIDEVLAKLEPPDGRRFDDPGVLDELRDRETDPDLQALPDDEPKS